MVSIFSDDVQQQMKEEIVESVMKTLSLLLQENGTKRYLRLAEASKYVGISQNTLKLWIEKYKLPVSCIEGVRLIDTYDLDAVIAKHKI